MPDSCAAIYPRRPVYISRKRLIFISIIDKNDWVSREKLKLAIIVIIIAKKMR